jgi:Bacterial PH domain
MTGAQSQAAGGDPAILPEGEPLVLNEWEQSLLFLFALVAGLIGLFLLVSSLQHHLHGVARPVAGFGWIGIAAFFFQAGRAGLVVEKDGVTLRGIIRRRHWAWREIERFEIKFVVYFPPLKINFKDGRHVRVRGFRGRTAKDRELADRRIAELNRRVQDARQAPV